MNEAKLDAVFAHLEALEMVIAELNQKQPQSIALTRVSATLHAIALALESLSVASLMGFEE